MRQGTAGEYLSFIPVEGALIRIKEMMDNVAAQLPARFRPWTEIEQAAESLRTWEPLLVPGLLQTADYGRVLFMGEPRGSAEKAGMDVAARLERQRVLEREEPPLLWVVIDEGCSVVVSVTTGLWRRVVSGTKPD